MRAEDSGNSSHGLANDLFPSRSDKEQVLSFITASKPATMTCSQIALGCEVLGGNDWGPVDLARARDGVRCALDCGISVFDTADVYGLGRGEEELSVALGADRHRVTIVTKGGVRWTDSDEAGHSPTWRDASRAYLSSAIDSSLRRLRIDAIPLYLVHCPDPDTPIDETIECLEQARVSGRILSYGLSNYDFDSVRAAAATCSISAIQGPLNILSSESLLKEYAGARRLGLATLTYGPLAQGLLTGKYSPQSVFDHTDRRHRLDHFSRDAYANNHRLLETLREVSDDVGRSPAQVAIRWVIDCGVANSVIVGARSPAQVLENYGAMSLSLSGVHLDKLKTARRLTGLASAS